VRGAKAGLATLFVGQAVYAPVKAQVVGGLKRGASGTAHLVRDVLYPAITERPLRWAVDLGTRLYGETRARVLPSLREYQGDLAVGALVIAVALALFLIMRLL
jgi:hypothetical protein